METQITKRIVVNPAIMAGKAVIRGTRIPVAQIMTLLAQGRSVDEILEEYPQLRKEDIAAALAYAAALTNSEEVFSFDDISGN